MCVYRNSKLIKCNGEHLITPECVQSFEVPWRYLVEKRGRVLVTSKRQDKQVTKKPVKKPRCYQYHCFGPTGSTKNPENSLFWYR